MTWVCPMSKQWHPTLIFAYQNLSMLPGLFFYLVLWGLGSSLQLGSQDLVWFPWWSAGPTAWCSHHLSILTTRMLVKALMSCCWSFANLGIPDHCWRHRAGLGFFVDSFFCGIFLLTSKVSIFSFEGIVRRVCSSIAAKDASDLRLGSVALPHISSFV